MGRKSKTRERSLFRAKKAQKRAKQERNCVFWGKPMLFWGKKHGKGSEENSATGALYLVLSGHYSREWGECIRVNGVNVFA